MNKKFTLIILTALLLSSCNTAKAPKEVFEPKLDSPNVQIGQAEIQFDKIFPLPGIRKIGVNVFYYPVEDAVCLRWRMDMMTYNQFWTYDGRELFVKYLDNYKIDYENKNFGRSSRRSKRVYGKTYGYTYWQMASFTLRAKGPNIVEFGYFFSDNSPYFTATQKDIEYIDPYTRDNNRVLSEITMYFTRSQADALAELFDPEYLAQVMSSSPPEYMEMDPDSEEDYIDEY